MAIIRGTARVRKLYGWCNDFTIRLDDDRGDFYYRSGKREEKLKIRRYDGKFVEIEYEEKRASTSCFIDWFLDRITFGSFGRGSVPFFRKHNLVTRITEFPNLRIT